MIRISRIAECQDCQECKECYECKLTLYSKEIDSSHIYITQIFSTQYIKNYRKTMKIPKQILRMFRII